MFCRNCGKELSNNAISCVECGEPTGVLTITEGISPKSRLVAFLLVTFLGYFGIHNFYLGRKGVAIIQLLLFISVIFSFITLIWVVVDWILILFGFYKDSLGRRLINWE